ncbi:FG-GAP-like repeat-containing protein [Flavobacterium sp.]|uniref:FG-GAP-like repeat-containing protein n=1 Tax=Flavobacterium sp. TaxID=239 RepID=UPI003B98EE29
MFRLITLIALVFSLVFTTSSAQNLKRKGGLGVSLMNNVPDSLKIKFDYQTGAFVLQVQPNSTAQNAGIQANDIVLKVNQLAIANTAELVAFAKTLRADDALTFEIKRDKKTLLLNAKVLPRPFEQSDVMTIKYGEFGYKNGWVRTILKTPKDKSPKAYIYFLQGLPCYSLDNMQPLDKTKQAIDKLVELGYAVYMMEKGDMGDNQNCTPCLSMGFTEELDMYDAGYQNLLKIVNVDKTNIFLFGHSMGGTTAPLLAAKYQPKGIVVYGTGFKPWSEYLADAFLIQSSLRGADLGDLRQTLEKFKPYLYQFFYSEKKIEEITKEPLGLAAMSNLLGYSGDGQSRFGRNMQTFKELNSYNIAKALSVFENYTLAIYGECDLNANSADDSMAMIAHVNSQRPGHGTFWLAPKSSHTFEEIGTMQEFIELWDNQAVYQQYAATRFNGKIFEYVDQWISEKLTKTTVPAERKYFRDASEQLPEPGAKRASMDVRMADIDGDKDLDIILANEFQPNTILINDGQANFTDESEKRLPQVIHDSEDIVSKDLDNDGDIDLVFCSEDDKVHEFYLNNGKGFYTAATFQFSPSEANAVISEDINKDGKPDIILGNNGQSQIYLNRGNATFQLDEKRLPIINKVTQDIAATDIDKDGDLDLIFANEDGNLLFRNNGKGFFEDVTENQLPTAPDMESRKVICADADKDGDVDLLFTNVNFRGNKNPQNKLYINNGKGKFTDETNSRLPKDDDHSIDASFLDIDGDSDLDIIVANVFGGKIKTYLNDGKGIFSMGSDRLLGGKIQIDALGIAIGDLNGDGENDIYICDRYNPQVDNKDVLLLREKRK